MEKVRCFTISPFLYYGSTTNLVARLLVIAEIPLRLRRFGMTMIRHVERAIVTA